MIQLVNLMAAVKPGLSILEMGTVVGGAVTTIQSRTPKHLGSLSQFVDYTFACSGEVDLQKFEAEPFHKLKSFMKLKTLNIEQDLQEQGFGNASFDMIIDSDVFNTNEYSDRASANIQKLLKRGGKFCMLKVTGPALRLTTALESLSHSPR